MTSIADGQVERYELGASVCCEDGRCGVAGRVVVDPILRSVTHLVVEPRHRHARARLVPIALLDTHGGELRLRCTLEVFRALERAEEADFLPDDEAPALGGSPGGGVGCGEAAMGYPGAELMSWPYYEPARRLVKHERVPLGDVEIRRGEHIHAADGEVGAARGLLVDRTDHSVTHVLLKEGHLRGAKDIAIPIGDVERIDATGVHVTLTKEAIAGLPGIALGRHATS